MKSLYITGCLGFIASHFTRLCLERGWVVFGVDKKTYASNPDLLEEFSSYPNFYFYEEDIQDLTSLNDCDYVINFAAESHVGNSIQNSASFISSNILGVQNLLELIRQHSTNTSAAPLYIQISTDEVYGDIHDGSHTEESLLKPSNPYSASKAAADMLVLAWARTYGVKYLIVRPTNNYGTHQYPEKLIPLAVKLLLREKKIQLHNGGTPIRNWLHVADTCDAIMCLLESGLEDEIYNVSGSFEQTNKDTIQKIIHNFLNILNQDTSEWEDLIDFEYNRVGQDVRYAVDDSKIRSLGWKPSKSFDEEISSIVQFYMENTRWV